MGSCSGHWNAIPQVPPSRVAWNASAPCDGLVHYKWVVESASCVALPDEYSGESLCRALQRQTRSTSEILMAGDSTARQWWEFLVRDQSFKRAGCHIAYSSTDRLLPPKDVGHTCDAQWWDCPGRSRLPVANEPISESGVPSNGSLPCRVPGVCWWDPRWLCKFSVIIVNSGLHYSEPAQYRQQIEFLRRAIATGAADDATLVWRDIVPVHADCNQVANQVPFSTLQAAEAAIARKPYHHGLKLKELNTIAAGLLGSDRGRTAQWWRMLDTYSSTVLRRDSHQVLGRKGTAAIDCLHYCDNSDVFAHWSRLLLALLLDNNADYRRSARAQT